MRQRKTDRETGEKRKRDKVKKRQRLRETERYGVRKR